MPFRLQASHRNYFPLSLLFYRVYLHFMYKFLYSVQRSVQTICSVLHRVFQMGSHHAATVSIKTLAAL